MKQEAVIALINDLTTRLSAVAAEIGVVPEQPATAPMVTIPACKENAEFGSVKRRAQATRMLDERRARRDFLPEELFHEPAWDMLLALYIAHVDRRTLNVKTLVACADAPVTTSQRWIDHLAKLGLVDRVIDPVDRRRVEVSLSDTGTQAIGLYLDHAARS